MGLINMDNQKLILDGMVDAIQGSKDNVYIFTNHSNRQKNKESAQGVFRIMELPEFEYFDGAIVAIDTITYTPTASFVMDKLRTSNIPFLTLNQPVEGHACLQDSSFECQYKVVEHFIKDHGYKNIIYVRGPLGNPEADIRYEAFLQALKDYHLPYKEENVFEGRFTVESGLNIAKQIHSKGFLADAIVCANDNMAIGVLEYFKRAGVRVPEDIKLAGFDNGENAMYSSPTITSIDKNPYELGRQAIYEICNIIDGANPKTIKISSSLVCRASCGCSALYDVDVEALKYKYVQMDICTKLFSDMINSHLEEFSGIQAPEKVISVLQKSIHRIGLKNFYLCLCERDKVYMLPETNMGADFDLMHVNTDYTERMELPLAYENGTVTSYKSFQKGMVLPEEIRKRGGGNYYVVTPICFQTCCYGYVVSGNDKLALKNNLYYSWLTNIGVAYENVRKRMLLQDAVIRLNNVWSYDMLTQLYNRAGFYYEAKTILEILKLQDSKIFVLFSDVDGLKKVNDTQGHEMGDELIKQMAACFKENVSNDMLAMRYGGDEFVIFGSYEDEIEIEYLVAGIQASIERRNVSGEYPFTLSTSIGISKYRAAEVQELSEVIELADINMYEQKRKKREQKNNI